MTVGEKSHLITFFVTSPFNDLNMIKMSITIDSMRKGEHFALYSELDLCHKSDEHYRRQLEQEVA